MRDFTFSQSRKPGTWKNTATGGAILVCPNCGKKILVGGGATPHTIIDGKVHPSVICPHNHCEFHEFVTLSPERG